MDDWIDRYIAAWNSHDARAIVEFMTDDAEYVHWWGSEWKTFVGRDVLMSWIEALAEEWSADYRLEKTFTAVTEDGFAIEYIESGTNDRGEDATGRPFVIRSAFIGELRDGKISRITDYAGLLEYQTQVSPTPHAGAS